MRRRAWVPLVAAVAVALLAACQPSPPATVHRFDLALDVRADGTSYARETLDLTFAASVTEFERVVENDRADWLTFDEAFLDGRRLEGAASVTATDGRSLRVTWRFSQPLSGRHEFGLGYFASRTLRLSGIRGMLSWPALPAHRAFAAEASRLTLTVPRGLLVDGSMGIAEAGWSVERTPFGIEATRGPVPSDEGATIVADITIDPSAMTEPIWQIDQARRSELGPAFLSGGIFILVVGAGILWIVRFQFPKGPSDALRAREKADNMDRAAAARNLRVGGTVCLVFAIAAGTLSLRWVDQLGWSLLAIAAGIVIVGAAFLAAGRRL